MVKDADKKFTATTAINANVPGTVTASITSTDKLSFDETLTFPDVSGSKDVNTMTEAEMQKIETTLYQRLMKAFPKLVSKVDGLSL